MCKKELIGHVGCVKTRNVNNDTIQNFALRIDKIDMTLKQIFTSWYNVKAINLTTVKPGDHVRLTGENTTLQFVGPNGLSRAITEFLVEKIEFLKEK